MEDIVFPFLLPGLQNVEAICSCSHNFGNLEQSKPFGVKFGYRACGPYQQLSIPSLGFKPYPVSYMKIDWDSLLSIKELFLSFLGCMEYGVCIGTDVGQFCDKL